MHCVAGHGYVYSRLEDGRVPCGREHVRGKRRALYVLFPRGKPFSEQVTSRSRMTRGKLLRGRRWWSGMMRAGLFSRRLSVVQGTLMDMDRVSLTQDGSFSLGRHGIVFL